MYAIHLPALRRITHDLLPFLFQILKSVLALCCLFVVQVAEQQKVTMYHKNVARQAQQVAAWLQKRRQENQARRAAGALMLGGRDLGIGCLGHMV